MLNVLWSIPHQWADLDVLRTFSAQTPPAQTGEAYLKSLRELHFRNESFHDGSFV
jgi:hypothetical protein